VRVLGRSGEVDGGFGLDDEEGVEVRAAGGAGEILRLAMLAQDDYPHRIVDFWRASSRESARTEKMTRRSARPMK